MWEVLQDTYKMHTRKYIEKIHKVFFTKRGAMQRQVRFVHKFSETTVVGPYPHTFFGSN